MGRQGSFNEFGSSCIGLTPQLLSSPDIPDLGWKLGHNCESSPGFTCFILQGEQVVIEQHRRHRNRVILTSSVRFRRTSFMGNVETYLGYKAVGDFGGHSLRPQHVYGILSKRGHTSRFRRWPDQWYPFRRRASGRQWGRFPPPEEITELVYTRGCAPAPPYHRRVCPLQPTAFRIWQSRPNN